MGSKDQSLLVRVRISAADVRSNFIDLAKIVLTEKGAGLLSSDVESLLDKTVFSFRFKVLLDKCVNGHVQGRSDSLDIFLVEYDCAPLTAVGAASAVDDLKRLLVQFCCHDVGFETIVLKLHAAEKREVLVIVLIGMLLPCFDNRVMIVPQFESFALLLFLHPGVFV